MGLQKIVQKLRSSKNLNSPVWSTNISAVDPNPNNDNVLLPKINQVSFTPAVIICCLCAFIISTGLSSTWLYSLWALYVLGFVVGLYLILSTFKLSACIIPPPPDPDIRTELDWPHYCILVPLYQESRIVDMLISHLDKLDYPKDKLDILLICETDDQDTCEAIKPYLKAPYSLITVPEGGPRTKPNALNYALKNAQKLGAMKTVPDIVTIYDAEDRPDPAQLKTAARGFHQNPQWLALQAPLRFYNARHNWLTRQFALEYGAHFYVWTPFLSRLSCPFPLGGTSNHILYSVLNRIDGWDSHNVTEDADISFRIGMLGGEIGYISCPTYEECVIDYKSWHNQRSRWIKGYMQTVNLHLHAPFRPGGWQGFKRAFCLFITLGASLVSSMFHLPFIVMMLSSALLLNLQPDFPYIPPWFAYSLGIGYFCSLLCGIIGAVRSRQFFLLWSIPFMALYWLLSFFPTLSALMELKTRPYYWNKTVHGVTDISNA